MARQVEIDLEVCIGCQACVELCPRVFQMDSTEQYALVMMSDLGDQEACVAEAIDNCPVHCMSWSQ